MSWTIALRPASFAGVGFYWRSVRVSGAQHLVIHNLPQAPADLENLGQAPGRFALTCYFIGADWLLAREAFAAVLQSTPGAATLVLPTKGPLRVRVASWTYEDNATLGNYGAVEVEFVIDAGRPAPFAATDAASAILNAITGVQQYIIAAYQNLAGPLVTLETTASFAASLLQSAASAFTALPIAIIGGVEAAFAATPTNSFATASAVTAAFLAASTNAVALINPPPVTQNAITGSLPIPLLPLDPSYGLAALTNFAAGLPPAPALLATQGAVQSAVANLVQQSAALAVVNLYAQTNFASAQDAATARSQLAALLDATGIAIYDQGRVGLYRAWLALEAQSIADMQLRAQNLPNLTAYHERRSLPDVVVAQRLLLDGTQGDALNALNRAIHPLFMPPDGVWLQAA